MWGFLSYSWVRRLNSLHIVFDHTSHMTGSSIDFLYLVIVVCVTGCTYYTSFYLLWLRRGSLTFIVCFFSSRKVCPVNWFNTAVDMSAVLGLVEPLILLDLLLGVSGSWWWLL